MTTMSGLPPQDSTVKAGLAAEAEAVVVPAKKKVWKGYAYPLGATWMGTGTNFAIYARDATKVELCLYDEPHASETDCITLDILGWAHIVTDC